MKNISLLTITSFVFAGTLLAQPAIRNAHEKPLHIDMPGVSASWRFLNGPEFPGAKGSLRADTVDGKKAGILGFDFTGGGNYLAAIHDIELPDGYSEMRFRVRGSEAIKLAVRLIDASGQTHQFNLTSDQPDVWQLLRVDLAGETSKAQARWGGAKDGRLHWPVKRIDILVQKSNDRQTGEVVFADMQAIP